MSHADRNLLFGILALQMDFIGRDVLIAAMHTWVLDKAKSLGQILTEQNALRADQHSAIEVLVNLAKIKELQEAENQQRKGYENYLANLSVE